MDRPFAVNGRAAIELYSDSPPSGTAGVVRNRKTLFQARSADANPLRKVVEGAKVKLSSVLSDILGKSGQRRILCVLVKGEADPATLTALADDRVRATPEFRAAALQDQVQ